MPIDTNLEGALADLFKRHATVERPLESVRTQAAFLGISAPQLSRLRNGVVPLTRKTARKFANAFGTNDKQRDEIFEELVAAYCGREKQVPKNLPTLKELNKMIAAREEAVRRHEQQLEMLRFARDNYEIWRRSGESIQKIEW